MRYKDNWEIQNKKKCPYVGVASQGQTSTKEWREENDVVCELCGAIFQFDDETGYFYHPIEGGNNETK